MATLTSVTAVKNQLDFKSSLTGTLTDDAMLADYVAQASTLIETLTDRQFSHSNGTLKLDNCPPYRYGRKLFFREHDVLGVYLVVNGNGATLTSDDYRLLPANSTPKYAIELKRGAGSVWQSPSTGPEEAITVAGTLGHNLTSAIPNDIQLAATRLAAWLYQTRDNKDVVIRYADGSAELPATAPKIVFEVVNRYIKDMMYT